MTGCRSRLRASRRQFSKNGQRVPILVRPLEGDRYSLIYGRRRLEACRELGIKVRAIVTEMEGDQALRDQLLENQERRDLSFIERALVAAALLDGDHLSASERTNKGVAEVLNLTEAGVSQLLSVVRTVGGGPGPSPSVPLRALVGPGGKSSRSCWGATDADRELLAALAGEAKTSYQGGIDEKSDHAFLAVLLRCREARTDHILVSPSRAARHGDSWVSVPPLSRPERRVKATLSSS